MVFSSIAFIMYFMPVFFLVYYILPASYKNAWLFLASLGFYYYGVRGNPGYLLLMIMSVVVNFVAGKLIEAQKTKRARKAWLVVGIVEYEDGTVHEAYPYEIRFLDGKLNEYCFDEPRREED